VPADDAQYRKQLTVRLLGAIFPLFRIVWGPHDATLRDVIPAKAGIHPAAWIPAFAGMTGCLRDCHLDVKIW